MIVQVNLLTDDGQLIARREGDAMSPLNFRTLAEVPLEDKRFRLYGWVYQPQTVLKPLEPTR
jgi:hypothetical protein